MSNSDNTTGLMSGGMESWKLISALFQMMVCIGSDGSVLPERSQIRNVRSNTGFAEECMLDISDVVLHPGALSSDWGQSIGLKPIDWDPP